MLNLIRTTTLFVALFLSTSSSAQLRFKTHKQDPHEKEEWERRKKEEANIQYNQSIVPDGLTRRFSPGSDQDWLLQDMRNAQDDQKKARLREIYGLQASYEFDALVSQWALMILTLSLFAAFFIKDKEKAMGAAVGLSVLTYLFVAYHGGNWGDFKLFLEVTWMKAMVMIAAIAVCNYLLLLLSEKVSTLGMPQKMIILVGIMIGLTMLTSYLCNATSDGSGPFFRIEEYKMNWTSCALTILLFAYILFQTSAKPVNTPTNKLQ